MKPITIKDLDKQKRELHKQAYIKKYPHGTFSIQVRESFITNRTPIKDHSVKHSMSLRWGTKINKNPERPFTTQYYQDGFELTMDSKFSHGINNAFGEMHYFSTLEKMLEKVEILTKKFNLNEGRNTYYPINNFVRLYSKYSGTPINYSRGEYTALYND